MTKKTHRRYACELCGITDRLELDHINEDHEDNSAGNFQTLCKHCHMTKTRMGIGLFNILREIVERDAKMKATMLDGSVKWLATTKDAPPKHTLWSEHELDLDPQSLYTKSEVTQIIQENISDDIRESRSI